MNSEDSLDLLWAKKTAVQQIQLTGATEVTFVCPFCSEAAYLFFTDDEGYTSHCSNGCFGKRSR
ncbi:hypothetical protein NZD89_08225 [Alicyclobacillus fastidiosus]|uniref:Uncharacterized protein n=1 Tax=Alicyclobacillus fastidiosus TaxID=392011 RepID=A0ABY6ZKA0_9BACL|nr:hypothetical protein [Alicyclobacillus fastidiosus]WAH43363.1 hypothetical protein NZD89_08225 [Alicyclobacillus fastidiosus]GMA65424.1 hypothetical protein GCM10025859_58640 [Alicyclobacillus fastidiosus]